MKEQRVHNIRQQEEKVFRVLHTIDPLQFVNEGAFTVLYGIITCFLMP